MKMMNRSNATDVNSEKGKNYFEGLHEMTYQDYIRDYEITRQSVITSDDYKFIAIVDGDISWALILEEGDSVIIHAQPGLERTDDFPSGGYSNTSGMAFIQVKDHMFLLDNSPFDLHPDDEDDESYFEDIYNLHVLEGATLTNTLFITQL